VAQTAYEILGVGSTQPTTRFGEHGEKHAFDLHPDRLGHVSERVRAVCVKTNLSKSREAYELLDDENRFLYDSMLREARASPSIAAAESFRRSSSPLNLPRGMPPSRERRPPPNMGEADRFNGSS